MRWRSVKKIGQKEKIKSPSLPYEIAPISQRLKALVVDTFMVLMPILYGVFYVVYGSREGFAQNMLEGWLLILVPYGMIYVVFFNISGQTPGYKAYEIKLIDTKTLELPSIPKLLARYLLMLIFTASIVALLVPFMRKDRLSLHDALCHTAPTLK